MRKGEKFSTSSNLCEFRRTKMRYVSYAQLRLTGSRDTVKNRMRVQPVCWNVHDHVLYTAQCIKLRY